MTKDHGSKHIGTRLLPIPVPISETPEEFSRLVAVHYFHASGRDTAAETVLHEGRTLYRTRILERPGRPREVYFDVTLRKLVPSSVPELRITEKMICGLKGRTGRLPDTGCLLCRMILDAQKDGLLRRSGGLELLAQVRHLALEGIATFRVLCSQCHQICPAPLAFEAEDLSACRPCQAIQLMNEEVRKIRHPKTRRIDPMALIKAVHSSAEVLASGWLVDPSS